MSAVSDARAQPSGGWFPRRRPAAILGLAGRRYHDRITPEFPLRGKQFREIQNSYADC